MQRTTRTFLDLYMDNSVSEKGLLGSVDVATSMAEFALDSVQWYRMVTGHGARSQKLMEIP